MTISVGDFMLFGPHVAVPIVNVRLTDGPEAAWTAEVAPVVLIGTVVVVGDGDCSTEAARTRHALSSLAETLSRCRAIVKGQVVSGKSNIVVVKIPFFRRHNQNRSRCGFDSRRLFS